MRLSEKILREKYLLDTEKSWDDVVNRVVSSVCSVVDIYTAERKELTGIIRDKKFIPAGRFLYSAGRPLHQVYNCLSLDVDDSREGWASLLWKSAMALQTGAGIGVRYNKIRPKGSLIKRTGGVASGVLSLIRMINAVGEEVIQGGSRRSAILAMLSIRHPDCRDFFNAKLQDGVLRCTNISVELESPEDVNNPLFDTVIDNMYGNGEPGLLMNYNTDDVLANACSEMSAAVDSTPCCLGSINLARITSLAEFERVLYYATLFLIAGTIYSHVPYPTVREVMEKHRRIGVGLMGIGEFLAKNKIRYGYSELLEQYLKIYETSTDVANKHCRRFGISSVEKSRAVAPTGTISLLAETTGGIEPIYCVEYIREYYNRQNVLVSEHVVDPVASRIMSEYGLPSVETAYDISLSNRLALQAQVQAHVDMRVSSTINFDRERISKEDLKKAILWYSKGQLKGVTVYPLNGRGNQPLRPILNLNDCKQGYCNS